MQAVDDHVKTLSQLGLNFCEARVYLALIHLGMCPAKMICKASNVTKPDVYRALASLQERALVEKIISSPSMFKAVPVSQSLSILLKNKDKEYDLLKKKTEELKHNLKDSNVKSASRDDEQQFILIPGKEALLERRRKLIKNAKKSVDVILSWKRFPQAVFVYGEETQEALQKGAKVRFITEKNDLKYVFEYLKDVRKYGLCRIRYVLSPPRAVVSIFDNKEVMISTMPSAGLGEAPVLWTNNMSIVTVMQEYFEMLWSKAERYEECEESSEPA